MAAPDPSKLDLQQILQRVYDEATGRLRTDAAATISNVSIAVDLDPTTDGVFIADKDSGAKLAVTPEGAIKIDKGLLAGITYNDIQATYPNSTTENYYYYLSASLQATIQVTYTTSTKDVLVRARRI
jgi:hypothetical protein